MRAYFLFVGDLKKSHHQEWICFTTTNRHGVPTFDFATVSGCDQLVFGPPLARGVTFYFQMNDSLDLVRVAP